MSGMETTPSTSGADPLGIPTDLPATTLVTTAAPRPKPMQSLVASARRITSRTITGGSFKATQAQGWQSDAWDMFDLVGEQRFLATTLAGRMSQAKLFVGRVTDNTEDPEPVTDEALIGILDAFGGSAVARAQMIARLGVNLFVPGDGWLCGIPRRFLKDTGIHIEEDEEGELLDLTQYLTDEGETTLTNELDEDTIDDLDWRMLSIDEISFAQREVTIMLGSDAIQDKIKVDVDDIYLIRVWRPHPRRSWEADSPTRSSLPVLRELVGLTMHISAQVDSRLAGAGVFIVPQSAVRAMREQMGLTEDDDEDPFTEALMEAMLKPIGDRSNASALVPLVVVVPDEATEKFHHLTFDKPLDIEARSLRDEAIRRLALGEDAPPELLLGTAGMNHWGAWLVKEDVVTTHVEPPLALICDAITSQYLHPVMRGMGWNEDTIDEYVVWYDVSHMIVRPNRGPDAERLFTNGTISDESYREANGFDESDAPETSKMGAAQLTVFEMIKTNPALVLDPGIEFLLEQVQALIDGKPLALPEPEPVPAALQEANAEAEEETDTDTDAETNVPETSDEEAEPPAMAASGLTAEQIIGAFHKTSPEHGEYIDQLVATHQR